LFLRVLDRCGSSVARHPSIGRRHRGPFRKQLVSAYPYGVFYAVQPSRVVIVAVLGVRQDPEAIDKRLGS
jgi:plasmid stabilization system protein ParE